MDISIDTASCIRCGKCARVCPSLVFDRPVTGSPVTITAPQSCIGCGHCVDACPEDAVKHELFPAASVHTIDYSALPSPEQVMLLCKTRRSNRAFSDRPVPAEMLDMIVEAAHSAPTGSNVQNVEFTLVTDPDKLKAITGYTVGIFSKALKMLTNPLLNPIVRRAMPDAVRYIPVFERLAQQYATGNDPILRGARAVLLIHTPGRSRMGGIDANLAYQNGSLMAESLGVSQFYTGFVINALKQDRKRALEKTLGIEGTIHAGMALGMPAFRFPKYVDRKGLSLTRL